ncbi:MAG TPA: hypothetical protein VNL96_03505 [Gemmatimonadaceae bacterium]|jgi:hypothetical protein|nr:hypothetical protein [Gemmatimonadaceae bacterium]
MALRQPLSLRHEYEQYVEQEIEAYKFSLPRTAILRIGDEAAAALRAREQTEFDELVLWAEVDRIIRQRLRLPSYATWRRRRLKLLARYRCPEHWGLAPDAPLVREIQPDGDTHVLVAGVEQEGPVLYLAAHGCCVTAVEEDEEAVDRVVSAAGQAGLLSRVSGQAVALDAWSPDEPVHAVVVTSAAFKHLTEEQRARAIEILKSATLDGGVHLVDTLVGAGESGPTVEELRLRYRDWHVAVVRDQGSRPTFLARKLVA